MWACRAFHFPSVSTKSTLWAKGVTKVAGGSWAVRTSDSPSHTSSRVSLHRHGVIWPADGAGNRRVFRTVVWRGGRFVTRADPRSICPAGHGRVRQPPLRQAFQRHETKSIHRPDAGPRSAGHDF